MIDYIKAFIVMSLLSIAGLFGIGFVVGFFMAIGGALPSAADNLEQALWFNLLILFCWPVISFFAFKFSVDKFLIEKH